MISDLARLPAQLLHGAGRAASALSERPASSAPRRSPVRTDRLSVRVPGLERVAAAALRDDLRATLSELPGVTWVAVNAPLQRVVVGLHAPGPDRGELLATVDAVCADHGAPAGAAPAELPDDDGVLRRAVAAAAADTLGLAVAAAGSVGHWLRWPAETSALFTVIDTQPRLREAVNRAMGRERADVVLAVGNAAAQAVSRGALGLGVDLALRVSQLVELRERRATWRAKVADLLGDAERAEADPLVVERPRALPAHPAEQYAARSAALAAAGGTLALAGGAGPRRAVAAALATLPKSSGTGREMFAAQLGRTLAGRGAQVLDRQALRRLDRVDAVVLDGDALTSGRLILADVVALPDVDTEQVQLRAHALFDPADPEQVRAADGWSLGPLDLLDLRGRTGARERRRLESAGARALLGLAHDRHLEAVAAVREEPALGADALVAAARRSGAELLVAGSLPHGTRPPDAPSLPAGRGLSGAVRRLQAAGRVVLLVSRRPAALAASDVGVGVDSRRGRPPWGAHVLVGDDLEAAALLIDAVDVAHGVARRSVQLSEAASALGALTAAVGPARGATSRALLAVNGAAALSLVNGAWAAAELARRPLSPPVSAVPWHMLPADAVLSLLDSRAEGLTGQQARQRRRPDVSGQPPPVGPLRAFAEELANPLTPILASGAALSAAIGSVVDAGIVVGATGLGALAGATQRLVTDRAIAELLNRTAVVTTVRRDGRTERAPADTLVTGDVVTVVPGDVVPADCRVLAADQLEMDESSLTGESFPVRKARPPVVASAVSERASMLYEGTTVAGGRGSAVVVATGSGTEAGRSMATARVATPVAGVEARLAEITQSTLPIALGSGAAVLAAGLLRGRPAQETLGAGVGLAVASVPEGLPFLVSAAQLAAARRLAAAGVLVRNVRTIEALGRVDVLCFDKTGTLTQGQITLAAVSTGGPPRGADTRLADLDPARRAVVAAGLRATPAPPPGRRLPHLTDRAVRDGASQLGVAEELGAPGWRPLAALPFEPGRGYHATLGEVGAAAGGDVRRLLSVKGAPELVLSRCATVRAGGRAQPEALTARGRRRLQAELSRLTGQGFRVLAVAEIRPARDGELTDDTVRDLEFLGYLALADPVRGTAGSSVEELQAAGAHVMMITGDHPETARAIADELGLLDGHRVVTGSEIDAMDDAELAAMVTDVAVVARGTPAHKVRVVRALQSAGRVVAMTGDGANDAPAIRLADVGIALGRRGTPAARAAADLVVADDRLETIIAALVEGRAMWRSVRQALAILVGGNLGEIGFTLLGSALTGVSPLSARQFLLVNLLTDLAPALAIALRRPQHATVEQMLQEGPESSLGAALTREVSLRAGATALGATAGWLAGRATGRGRRAQTIGLASLVGTQLGQTLLIGGSSPGVLAASIGSAAALAAVVQTPGVSQFFGCTPLGPVAWGIAGASAAGATAFGALRPGIISRLPAPLRPSPRVQAILDPDHLAGLARERFGGLVDSAR